MLYIVREVLKNQIKKWNTLKNRPKKLSSKIPILVSNMVNQWKFFSSGLLYKIRKVLKKPV